MKTAARWAGSASFLVVLLTGCGTHTIPIAAVPGTTITVPVPDGFGAGFGRALNTQLSTSYGSTVPGLNVPIGADYLEDYQNGELLFALYGFTFGCVHKITFITYLPVRYITRVHVDEASRQSMPAVGEPPVIDGTGPMVGQVLAFVDIPGAVPAPGQYCVFVERWKRSPASPTMFEEHPPYANEPPAPWRGWTGWYPQWGLKLNVVDPPAGWPSLGFVGFNPFDVYDKVAGNYAGGQATQEELGSLAPRPKLTFWVHNVFVPPLPAAWEVAIQYPLAKIEILGVELGALHRSAAIASLGPTTGTPGGCSDLGSTKISVVDPDQEAPFANVVYRVRDFVNCGRAVEGDFAVLGGSFKAYDVNGSQISNPYFYLDNAYSFR